MIRLLHPEALWLLALLPLAAMLRGRRGPAAALRFPSLAVAGALGRARRSRAGLLLAAARLLVLACVVVALARPQLGRGTTEIEQRGIDIMLAVDVSTSMEALDFEKDGERVNRVEAVKAVVAKFIEARPNDRIGLVAFAGRPYLVSPLTLDHDDQYRRSEDPYAGPDELAATAWANWDDAALYLAVEVTKPDLVLRPADAPPLRLDNEPDDIHSDGVQVYLAADAGSPALGALVVPEEGDRRLRVRPAGAEAAAGLDVHGDWSPTDTGYLVTLAIRPPDWAARRRGERVAFDLIVNEMRPGRERRAGQLVWSGRGGWVWLRGDRQPRASFGELELA